MSLTAPWAGRRTVQSAKDQSDLGRRWRPVLLAYFLRRVRNHAEAEDLTQELLAKLVSLDGSALDSPEAYIFQMASNLLADRARRFRVRRSEEHTSELQSLMRISYAVFCLKKKKKKLSND